MIVSVPIVATAQGLAPEILLAAIRGAHIEPCLLSARPVASRLARFTCYRASLDFASLGPALHITGMMSRACYTLVFVLRCPEKGHSFNFATEHTDGYMGFFPPGGELDAATPQGFATATLTVPVDVFHAALEQHVPDAPSKVLKSGAGMRIGPAEQFRLRGLLDRLEKLLWHSPEALAGPLIRHQIEGELLAVFCAALRSGCADLVPPPTIRTGGRLRRLRQARDFLTDHTRSPICLDDLCASLGITRRGVENLFQDLLGISPLTYLRHHRLHGARRSLLETAPAPGVVKFAAREWGFVHLGRFAQDYRTLFGESPGGTLTRG